MKDFKKRDVVPDPQCTLFCDAEEKRKLTDLERTVFRIFPDAKMICTKCSQDVDQSSFFCKKCGTKI